MSEPDPDRSLRPARYEPEDVRFKAMLGLLALIGGGLLFTLAVAWLLFPNEIKDQRFMRPFPNYPGPALQVSPGQDMAAFRSEELRRLNSVGWIDRPAGRVHVPIEQAMRAVAAEGIADWPSTPDIAPEDRR